MKVILVGECEIGLQTVVILKNLHIGLNGAKLKGKLMIFFEFLEKLISADDFKRIQQFKSFQPEAYAGTSGGRYTYSFTPTSLGVVIVIEDNLFKRKLDITPYHEW